MYAGDAESETGQSAHHEQHISFADDSRQVKDISTRRHFDAEFERCGGISTRSLNGAAAFRRGILTARRGISTRNFNGAARHFDAEFLRRGDVFRHGI
jgi:hypothetical protein